MESGNISLSQILAEMPFQPEIKCNKILFDLVVSGI